MARFAQIASALVLQALLLLGGAGRLDWLWAWIFLGICLVSVSVNGAIVLRTRLETVLETVAERARPQWTKSWDKLVAGLYALALFLVLPLLAGLDVRFGWTGPLGRVWHVAGAAMLAAGLGLAGWAMIANAYFSTTVRVQRERGHVVCRTGPYQFVRHPGYAGFIIQSLGTPVLLGSWWALIPGAAAATLMVVRTSLEDRMLQAELPGYPEFVKDVRYRLVPGLW